MITNSITTPIFYANAKPHIGHLYSVLIMDAWRRTGKLLKKDDTLAISGMDEHGQKVFQTALGKGMNAQDYVNNVSIEFLTFFKKYSVLPDVWVRTTDKKHEIAVIDFWKRLEKNGYIYKGKYEGFYSISDENYLPDFDKDKWVAEEKDKGNIVWREEECYYFKLSAFQEKLEKFYKENEDFIFPKKRYNEAMGFIKQGLRDFVVSRPKSRLTWGITVPSDPEHVIYVWVDALVNYLSAIGYPDPKYNEHWPTVHILGKDILKFHAVYWVAMLMGADHSLPRKMIIHGWLLNGDAKISKSANNAIPLDELTQKYSSDGFRYYLLKGVRLGEDAEFKEEFLRHHVYKDLADKFGNFISRLAGMSISLLDGVVNKTKNYEDEGLMNGLQKTRDALTAFYEDPSKLQDFLDAWLLTISEMNSHINDHKIWLITDKKDLANRIYFLADLFKKMAILISPILPETSEKIEKMLNFKCSFDDFHSPLPNQFSRFKEILFPK
jgi:methionyl-tRNA synthetase